MPSILIDTNMISGIAKRDLPPQELKAAAQIMGWVQSSWATVAASTVARDELDRIPLSKRGQHDVVFNALNVLKTHSGVTYFDPNSGSVIENPTYKSLRNLLPDEPDARMLAIGEEHGQEFFWTFDHKSILSRRSQVEAICSIKPRLGTEIVAELSQRSI